MVIPWYEPGIIFNFVIGLNVYRTRVGIVGKIQIQMNTQQYVKKERGSGGVMRLQDSTWSFFVDGEFLIKIDRIFL